MELLIKLMDLLINALVSFVASVTANILTELTKERAPALAQRLINASARRLAASARDRYRQEWLADIHQLLEKEQWAGALALAITVYLWHGRRVARTVGRRVSRLQALAAAVVALHFRWLVAWSIVMLLINVAVAWVDRTAVVGPLLSLVLPIAMGVLGTLLIPTPRRLNEILVFASWFGMYKSDRRLTVRDVARLYTLLAERGHITKLSELFRIATGRRNQPPQPDE